MSKYNSTLTTATGAFAPALFADSLHNAQMWVVEVGGLSESDMLMLAAHPPTVFRTHGKTYIAWGGPGYSVLVHDELLLESIEDAYDHPLQKVIVAFAERDTVVLTTVAIDEDFICWLQAAGQCGELYDTDTEERAPNDLDVEDMPDDIDFGDDTTMIPGLNGENSYVLRVRHVGNASSLINSRRISHVHLSTEPEANHELIMLAGEKLDSEGSAPIGSPLVVGIFARNLTSLFKEVTFDIPVLLFFLPGLMFQDLMNLASSELVPVNVIARSGAAIPHYVLQGKKHELLLDTQRIARTLSAAIECGELILVFGCEDHALVRYLQIDSDWEEQDGVSLSAAGAGSHAPIPEGTPEAAANHAAIDAEPKRISWYPLNIADLPPQYQK